MAEPLACAVCLLIAVRRASRIEETGAVDNDVFLDDDVFLEVPDAITIVDGHAACLHHFALFANDQLSAAVRVSEQLADD